MACGKRWILAAIAVVLVPFMHASDFVNPRLKAKEADLRSIVILPPTVEESQTGVRGTAGMGKAADDASAYLSAAVTTALANRGLTVSNPFSEEMLKENDDLRYTLADVQERFDAVSLLLFKKRKDVRKGRFTLGDMVAVLDSKGTTDAFVIIRAVGRRKTKAKAFMTGGVLEMAMSGKATFTSRVALVDAKSGDILFLGDYISRGLPTYETYEKSFRRIPAPR